jgi:hypothetical protein
MKKLKLSTITAIALYAVLCLVFFSSCHNHINEYTVVKSIEANTMSKQKYKVELDFFMANQYLYTDTVFAVGDTLWLRKKY